MQSDLKKISLLFFVLLGFFSFSVFSQGNTDYHQNYELVFDEAVRNGLNDLGVNEVDINVSKIECAEGRCFSTIFQDGLINTVWTTPSFYCVEVGFDDKNVSYCVVKREKSLEDLVRERNLWVRDRVSGFVLVEVDRANQERIVFDNSGGTARDERG